VQGEIGADIVSGGAGNDVLFGDRVFGADFLLTVCRLPIFNRWRSSFTAMMWSTAVTATI
jgi:hypothetical protein